MYLAVDEPFSHRPLLLASALPTYFLASLVHQPRPRPIVRFTRSSDVIRAAVLFAYGRLMGTPFNLVNYILDLLSEYGLGAALDRPEGMPRKWSDFLVYALATGVSGIVFDMIPRNWGLAWTIVGALDRTLWRASWMALVDDVVKVLGYPRTEQKRGKVLVMGVQGVLIAVSVMWVYFVWWAGMGYSWQKERMTQGGEIPLGQF